MFDSVLSTHKICVAFVAVISILLLLVFFPPVISKNECRELFYADTPITSNIEKYAMWFWSTHFLVLNSVILAERCYSVFVLFLVWLVMQWVKKVRSKIVAKWVWSDKSILVRFGTISLVSIAQEMCAADLCVRHTYGARVTYVKPKIHSQLPMPIIYRCLKCLAAAT